MLVWLLNISNKLNNLNLKFILAISLMILSNCFEYEETIHFKKGFSGFVEVVYQVPVNPKTEKSFIKHLPISQEDIESRLNKGFFNKNFKIKDYSVELIEKNPDDGNNLYIKKAKVSFKYEFTEPSHLDGVLIGQSFIKKKNNSIYVKREFKSILKALDQNSSAGEKKIYAETQRLLGDGSIQFKVYFPISSECRSSKGEVNLGSLNYRFPLLDTVEKPGIKTWDYQITIF
ncbi:MAG: hypothetical protein SFU98_03840 [Leptospiraceae bacterium]|nr:hypothetical protein [Leptospiraceae bacterium]